VLSCRRVTVLQGALVQAKSVRLELGDNIFNALHVMQTRYSDENSVRPSVCLSVTRVHCDKTEERTVHIFKPYER